jgi:hypothetical protein
MIKATLEINGKSAAIDGSVNGSVQAFLGQPGVANQQSHEVTDGGGNALLLYVTDANLASVGNIPFTIDVPLDFTFDSSDTGGIFGTFHSGNLATALDFSPTELIYQYPSTDGGGRSRSRAIHLGLDAVGFRQLKRVRLPPDARFCACRIGLILSKRFSRPSTIDFHPAHLCSAVSGRLRPPCFCCGAPPNLILRSAEGASRRMLLRLPFRAY